MPRTQALHFSIAVLVLLSNSGLGDDQKPVISYEADVAPILQKYCVGCHNDADKEGNFSAESYASLNQGTAKGPGFLAEEPESSRILLLMTGKASPQMPPEGEAAPTPEEIEKIRLWIAAGAKGPAGEMPDRMKLHVPKIAPQTDQTPYTAISWSPDGKQIALGRFGEVLLSPSNAAEVPTVRSGNTSQQTANQFSGLPGKVTAVHFANQGKTLVASSGIVGLGGIAKVWNVDDPSIVKEFRGHRDIMFDAEISPDGKRLATCSYDQSILLWDTETGELLRTLSGHNGAVYDLEFTPDSQLLLSASADATCKVWRVSDGLRLDTLGQPLKEQYCVAISPDGKSIVAGGADNRIRVWDLVSRETPRINPLKIARFAHEGPIVCLEFSPDGKHLVSVAEDRTIKVWETESFTETELIKGEPEVAVGLTISPDNQKFAIARLDGTIGIKDIKRTKSASNSKSSRPNEITTRLPSGNSTSIQEQEPNQTPVTAETVSIPAVITGKIHSADQQPVDEDCFRFSAKAGEEWVFEVQAERAKSKLDSVIEILTTDGHPVERLILQAVRDSYFTFRGKTADQANDFRLFNWQEMELNEFIYANGEVVKLWLYPRGPDSGFDVYPGSGKRWGYFDTTPLAHALGEPVYVVKPHPPGTELIPNGLPVFPVYYRNDDEAQRSLGKDSKLLFTAPADSDYVLRIRDVRGMQGDNFDYQLTIRPRKEDFSIDLADKSLTIPRGGSRELRFNARRLDQFEGPIDVTVIGLPEGYSIPNPITVQEGQIAAYGIISTSKDAAPLAAEDLAKIQFTASAIIRDEQVQHNIKGFSELKIDDQPKLEIAIGPAEGGAQPLNSGEGGPLEFEIYPGQTIMLQVNANRINHNGEISFGKEDAGRNLPHGIIVDNIGLNGLLLLEDQSQREFFITAAAWCPEQSRLFHLKTNVAGAPATKSVLLHVRKPSPAAQSGAD